MNLFAHNISGAFANQKSRLMNERSHVGLFCVSQPRNSRRLFFPHWTLVLFRQHFVSSFTCGRTPSTMFVGLFCCSVGPVLWPLRSLFAAWAHFPTLECSKCVCSLPWDDCCFLRNKIPISPLLFRSRVFSPRFRRINYSHAIWRVLRVIPEMFAKLGFLVCIRFFGFNVVSFLFWGFLKQITIFNPHFLTAYSPAFIRPLIPTCSLIWEGSTRDPTFWTIDFFRSTLFSFSIAVLYLVIGVIVSKKDS